MTCSYAKIKRACLKAAMNLDPVIRFGTHPVLPRIPHFRLASETWIQWKRKKDECFDYYPGA